jgi:hypothetical protein
MGVSPPLVRRKTGIWHKHRRIAASEAAIVALMSIYAPWIQPGYTQTHTTHNVSLPTTSQVSLEFNSEADLSAYDRVYCLCVRALVVGGLGRARFAQRRGR